jgi:dynactin complex subunit
MSNRETALLEENTHLKEQITELANVIESKEQTIRVQQNRLNDLLKRTQERKIGSWTVGFR